MLEVEFTSDGIQLTDSQREQCRNFAVSKILSKYCDELQVEVYRIEDEMLSQIRRTLNENNGKATFLL